MKTFLRLTQQDKVFRRKSIDSFFWRRVWQTAIFKDWPTMMLASCAPPPFPGN